MTQAVPSTLLYGQVIKLISDFQDAYKKGIGSVDDISVKLREVISSFENGIGIPFTDFDPVAETEPPLSSKINELWKNVQFDVNILQNQVDVLRAATLFAHNLIATEVGRASGANARVNNKIKTLQLYSNSTDSSIITFGDAFRSLEFVDTASVSPQQQAILLSEGHLTLGQQGELVDLSSQSNIQILPESNGLSGNLHEVTSGTRLVNTWEKAPQSTTAGLGLQPIVFNEAIFKAESDARSSLASVVDGEPNTWFEYESCAIDPKDRLKAQNFNFAYQNVSSSIVEGESGPPLYDWASGPVGGTLKLSLEIDLRDSHVINYISYTPFNLEDNANYPVKVARLETSLDGSSWTPTNPTSIFVGTTPNLQAARTAADVVIGDATWAFANRIVRYIRINLEQAQSIPRNFGHIYYLNRAGNRVEGPIPTTRDPLVPLNPAKSTTGELVARREVFAGRRWAIGIRDLTVKRINYAESSSIVTKPLRAGGIVDRVSLEADIMIPTEFPQGDWIQFFVSPDEGVSWFRIARVQDDFTGVPEILAFNDPTPLEFRELGVAYHQVSQPVTSLRFRALLLRPPDVESAPVLKSYKLKVKKR